MFLYTCSTPLKNVQNHSTRRLRKSVQAIYKIYFNSCMVRQLQIIAATVHMVSALDQDNTTHWLVDPHLTKGSSDQTLSAYEYFFSEYTASGRFQAFSCHTSKPPTGPQWCTQGSQCIDVSAWGCLYRLHSLMTRSSCPLSPCPTGILFRLGETFFCMKSTKLIYILTKSYLVSKVL